MVRERPITPGSGPSSKLPQGSHRLSRAEVERSQRDRLLAAAAMAVSDHGYASFTVRHVIEGAEVSRHTFYEHFANKREVMLAAYDQSFARLLEEFDGLCASQPDWPAKVGESIAIALRLAAAEPATAALVTIHAVTAGREGEQRVLDSGQYLASLLAAGKPGGGEGEPDRTAAADGSPGLIERALVGAIWATVATHLMAGEPERLPELAPRLAELTLLPYRREHLRTGERAELT